MGDHSQNTPSLCLPIRKQGVIKSSLRLIEHDIVVYPQASVLSRVVKQASVSLRVVSAVPVPVQLYFEYEQIACGSEQIGVVCVTIQWA